MIDNTNSAIATTEQLKDYFLEPRRPGEKIWITSNALAELMEIEHHNIMKIIANNKMSNDFKRVNFERVDIIEKSKGGSTINRSHYKMTRDGFFLVSMGLHSRKAMLMKEMIVARFNVLENYYFQREGYTAAANRRLVHKTVAEMKYAGYDAARIGRELAPTQSQQREERMESLCETFGVGDKLPW